MQRIVKGTSASEAEITRDGQFHIKLTYYRRGEKHEARIYDPSGTMELSPQVADLLCFAHEAGYENGAQHIVDILKETRKASA